MFRTPYQTKHWSRQREAIEISVKSEKDSTSTLSLIIQYISIHSACLSYIFPERLHCCYIDFHCFLPGCTATIIPLEPCALNAESQHFSCSLVVVFFFFFFLYLFIYLFIYLLVQQCLQLTTKHKVLVVQNVPSLVWYSKVAFICVPTGPLNPLCVSPLAHLTLSLISSSLLFSPIHPQNHNKNVGTTKGQKRGAWWGNEHVRSLIGHHQLIVVSLSAISISQGPPQPQPPFFFPWAAHLKPLYIFNSSL
jgi:hypothetical protein